MQQTSFFDPDGNFPKGHLPSRRMSNMTEDNCGARKQNTFYSFRADTKDFGNNGNLSSDTTDHKTKPSLKIKKKKYIHMDDDKSLAKSGSPQ